MLRKAMDDLIQWKSDKGRKPLVIRGARQVGKTWLVREFAQTHFESLVEINFDRTPDKSQLFASPEIDRCLKLIEVDSGVDIVPGRTLLFLDEIQAAPDVLPRLRYFFEERPDIHLVAAGSLLEFLLADHEFSMPVGRVEYLHLGPMDFDEFLLARGDESLRDFLSEVNLNEAIPDSIHNQLLDRLRLFWAVGGMPMAVRNYAETEDSRSVAREHESLLQTYEDDFGKYGERIYPQRLRKVFRRLPALIGRKLKYSNLNPEERSKDLIQCLDQLEMARIFHRVYHSSGNGVPLGAEINERDFKPLFLDIGLVSSSLGLDLVSQTNLEDLLFVNEGALAEQFVGQQLLNRGPSYKKPELYYWNREKENSAAEVDYLISLGDRVIPIEVKAGKSGRLKSLQVFVAEKKAPIVTRFNTRPPKFSKQVTSVRSFENRGFDLLSLPLYLVGETERLLREVIDRK